MTPPKVRRSVRLSKSQKNQSNLLFKSKPPIPAKTKKSKERAKKFKKAANQRQSPIDIIPQHVCFDADVCKADSLNIDYKLGDCCDVIVNGGGFRVNAKRHCSTYLTANHLPPAKFEFAQFHAHWGCNSKEGSEHRLDGKVLSGEVHIVFWNTDYESFNKAAEQPDGLAVIAVFLKEGEFSDNYHSLIDTVRKATGNTTPIAMPKEFHLEQLLPAPDKRDFLTYLGSLTTPPYNESVIWTIFTQPIEVSYGQLNVLRNIIPANHRECQDRCNREIRSSHNF